MSELPVFDEAEDVWGERWRVDNGDARFKPGYLEEHPEAIAGLEKAVEQILADDKIPTEAKQVATEIFTRIKDGTIGFKAAQDTILSSPLKDFDPPNSARSSVRSLLWALQSLRVKATRERRPPEDPGYMTPPTCGE